MATDRIHHTGEIVAGALMSSGAKRKVEELGGHGVSAAVGDLFTRAMSAAVGRYEAHANVDDQLARLDMLLIRVHSAVEVAEGVHIRSWWLRRWLWRLRDAALDGDEVLRLFRSRQQDKAGSRAAGAGNTLWNATARTLRSARSLLLLPLLSRDDDDRTQRLHHVLAALERDAKDLGEFLKLLHLEIRRPPPAPAHHFFRQNSGTLSKCVSLRSATLGKERLWHSAKPKASGKGPVFGSEETISFHYTSTLWREENVAAGTGHMVALLIVMRQHIRRAVGSLALNIRRAVGRLIREPAPRTTRAMSPDAGELHDLVARIQRAVHDTRDVELRNWLAKWRGELQAVANTAERVLLTLPVKASPDGIDFVDDVGEELRRTAQSVEAAVAHLEDFVTLVRLQMETQTPQRHGGRGRIVHPQARLFFFLSLLFLLMFSLCVAAALLGWRHGWAEVNDRRRALPRR